MSIDITEMVRMAGAYSGWDYAEYFRPEYVASVVTREDGHVETIAHCLDEQYGEFIAQAPTAILVLSERVATLEAQNAALQARVEALGEDEDCPVCGGTGWIQEGWGDYHMDGIPCGACAYDEEEEE